jgi:hypothetical protein
MYGNTAVSVVLYGCKTWSATLRVFETGVLREICGAKEAEVRREWRILHKEKLHGLQSSPNFIRLTE